MMAVKPSAGTPSAFCARMASRTRSSVANGLAAVPGLASLPSGATWNSAALISAQLMARASEHNPIIFQLIFTIVFQFSLDSLHRQDDDILPPRFGCHFQLTHFAVLDDALNGRVVRGVQ